MNSYWKHFGPATIVSAMVVLVAALFGGIDTAAIVLILGILEISLSVDNAVVNAVKLQGLSKEAQRWFLYYGILIAVFGMRLIIPALIVSVIGHMGPLETFSLAVHNPKQYGLILQEAHPILAAFGGSFLFMIFANYFIDRDKETHWLPPLELPLLKLARWEFIKVFLVVAAVAGFGYWQTQSWTAPASIHFYIAGAVGIISYLCVEGLGTFVERFEKPTGTASGKSIGAISLKMAIPALLYLEVVDASMSFDGVMGAFALTSDILVIMAGLGIGALYVRSLTLLAVEKGTLAEFRYLENGAFWAIGVLAMLLFVTTKTELPDWFVGLLSAGIIAASVVSSIRANRQEAALSV